MQKQILIVLLFSIFIPVFLRRSRRQAEQKKQAEEKLNSEEIAGVVAFCRELKVPEVTIDYLVEGASPEEVLEYSDFLKRYWGKNSEEVEVDEVVHGLQTIRRNRGVEKVEIVDVVADLKEVMKVMRELAVPEYMISELVDGASPEEIREFSELMKKYRKKGKINVDEVVRGLQMIKGKRIPGRKGGINFFGKYRTNQKSQKPNKKKEVQKVNPKVKNEVISSSSKNRNEFNRLLFKSKKPTTVMKLVRDVKGIWVEEKLTENDFERMEESKQIPKRIIDNSRKKLEVEVKEMEEKVEKIEEKVEETEAKEEGQTSTEFVKKEEEEVVDGEVVILNKEEEGSEEKVKEDEITVASVMEAPVIKKMMSERERVAVMIDHVDLVYTLYSNDTLTFPQAYFKLKEYAFDQDDLEDDFPLDIEALGEFNYSKFGLEEISFDDIPEAYKHSKDEVVGLSFFYLGKILSDERLWRSPVKYFNFTLSMYYFFRSADFGNPSSQVRIANYLNNKMISRRDFEFINSRIGLTRYNFSLHERAANSMTYLFFSAMDNDPKGFMSLGYRYHQGIGVNENCESAMNYYSMASSALEIADPDFSFVRYKLNDPNTIKEHLRKESVAEYIKYSAERGNSHSMINYGQQNLHGTQGVGKNPEKAAEFFKRAAENGNPMGYGQLGNMYAYGLGVEKNTTSAVEFFEEGVKNDDQHSMNGLGVLYLKGIGVNQNFSSALYYFNKSANLGNNNAMFNLAQVYVNRKSGFHDPKKAFSWMSKAAAHGKPIAFRQLAIYYQNGIGTAKNCPQSVRNFKKYVEAYFWTFVGKKAWEEYLDDNNYNSLVLFLLFAGLGDQQAQLNAAYLFETLEFSPLVEKLLEFEQENCDIKAETCFKSEKSGKELMAERALYFYKLAADQGSSDAQVKVGDYCYYGIGSEVNYNESAKYYALAKSNSRALYSIGYLHEFGQGLQKDLHLAKRNYDKALERNKDAYFVVVASLMRLYIKFGVSYLENIIGIEFNWDFVEISWSRVVVCILLFVGLLISYITKRLLTLDKKDALKKDVEKEVKKLISQTTVEEEEEEEGEELNVEEEESDKDPDLQENLEDENVNLQSQEEEKTRNIDEKNRSNEKQDGNLESTKGDEHIQIENEFVGSDQGNDKKEYADELD